MKDTKPKPSIQAEYRPRTDGIQTATCPKCGSSKLADMKYGHVRCRDCGWED